MKGKRVIIESSGRFDFCYKDHNNQFHGLLISLRNKNIWRTGIYNQARGIGIWKTYYLEQQKIIKWTAILKNNSNHGVTIGFLI